jgi:molecular chaperone GrpE (heat shock protein)
MSETPRTDDLIELHYWHDGFKTIEREMVPADFARQLERELASAEDNERAINASWREEKARREKAEAHLEELKHYYDDNWAAENDALKARAEKAERAVRWYRTCSPALRELPVPDDFEVTHD